MTYLDLIRDAEFKLEHNEITLGEYYEMIEPLRREVEQEPKTGVLDKIRAEIIDKSYLSYDNNPRHIIDESWVLEIIDKIQTGE